MLADHLIGAVRAVLGGAPVSQAAEDAGIAAGDLAAAVEVFERAGRVALEDQTNDGDWYQVRLAFPTGADSSAIEQAAAAELAPRLERLETIGTIGSWWFLRKTPGLRLRVSPSSAAPTIDAVCELLSTSGVLASWCPSRYEPEVVAFGGRDGMAIAHELFAADSRHVLAYLRDPHPAIGRAELSVVLCTTLLRGAGTEWFESGDVWQRVARYRPTPDTGASTGLGEQLRVLLGHDPRPDGPLFREGGPLERYAPWATAFERAGQALAAAASKGRLRRGLRATLAHHVIFHWNRIGMHTALQALLATTATEVILADLGPVEKPST